MVKTDKYTKDSLTKTAFKHSPEQGRFSFCAAKVKKIENDAPEGVRMEAINYSGKNTVTIDIHEEHIKTKFKIVKSWIGGKKSPWVTNEQPKDELWLNDPVSKKTGAIWKEGENVSHDGN